MTLSNEHWALLAFVIAVNGFAAWWKYRSEAARTRRALRAAHRSEVATAAEGRMAKVVGVLGYAGEPLRAPFSGRACAAYEAKVWIPGRNRHLVASEAAHADFWLNDGTGTALVRMKDARVRIQRDATKRSGVFHAATSELEAFLRRHGQSSVDEAFGVSFNKSLTYEEGILEAGEQIAVLGYATREEDVSPGTAPGDSRYGRSRRLVLQAKGDEMPLCVSDEPDLLH